MQTFDEAKTAFSKAKVKSTGRPLEGRTTRLLQKGDCFVVRYQETDVVCYKPDGLIVLDDGGWRTVTTKDRINNYSPGSIYQKDGIWYYNYNGKSYVWESPLTILPNGELRNGQNEPLKLYDPQAEKEAKKFLKTVKQYADTFIEKLFNRELESPSSGDCFFCLCLGNDGGEHIRSHIQEKYYVPSLLNRALKWQSSIAEKEVVSVLWKDSPKAATSEIYFSFVRKRLSQTLYRYCLKEMGLPY